MGNEELSEELTIPRLEGFTFIPSLGFYVADEVRYSMHDWHSVKEKLEEVGSFMLTPSQFWEYYEHCAKNRRNIFHNAFENEDREHLDAFLTNHGDVYVGSRWDKRFNNRARLIKSDRTFSQRYLIESGRFNPVDIDLESGLPDKVDPRKGLYRYKKPNVSEAPYGESLLIEYDQREGLTLKFIPKGVVSLADKKLFGVRPCKYLEK